MANTMKTRRGTDTKANDSQQETDSSQTKRLTGKEKTQKMQEQAETLAEKDKEIAQLKALLRQKPSKSRRVAVQKASAMDDEEKRWFGSISAANKKYNWGKVKFCNTETKLTKLTANIFDKWNLKEFRGLVGEARDAAKSQWVIENKEYVRMAMNNVRNYAQSQLRNWVVEALMKGGAVGQGVPNPEQVKLCALRDKSIITDPKMKRIFDIYHDVLLFKVVGKEHWDDWIRHYKTISGAVHDSDKTNPCITINTEAFLVAVYENCWTKWLCIVEEKKKYGRADKKREDARHKTQFIDVDGGQARWGGWNKAGLERVKNLVNEIKEAHKQDHVEALEKEALERVRQAQDIENRDEKKKNKKKKRKRPEIEEEDDDDFDSL